MAQNQTKKVDDGTYCKLLKNKISANKHQLIREVKDEFVEDMKNKQAEHKIRTTFLVELAITANALVNSKGFVASKLWTRQMALFENRPVITHVINNNKFEVSTLQTNCKR